MLVIFGFSLTFFFGFLLTLSLVSKMHPLERLGVAYVLGLGLLTLFMFFYSLAGYKFNLANTLVVLLILILILLFFTYKKIETFGIELRSNLSFRKSSKIEKTIILVVCLFILYSLLSALYWPVHSWDAVAYYDFRAKVFFNTASFDEAISKGYFFGYPLMTSLAHTWVYLLGGKNPLFIYALLLLAFTAMFYGALREFTSRRISLIALFLLFTVPVIISHSSFAYTNFPYTVYFVMGTIYLYIWMVKQKKGYLLLSSLMVGLSTWTRSSEPFWLTNLAILVLFSLWKREFLAPVFYSLLFFSIQQPWKMMEAAMPIGAYTTTETIRLSMVTLVKKFSFSRSIEVLLYLFKTTVEPWILFVVLLGLVIVKKGRKIFQEKETLFLAFIIINFILLILGGYVFSFGYSEWRAVSESATRMTMFFPPLIIFYLGISGAIEGVIKK